MNSEQELRERTNPVFNTAKAVWLWMFRCSAAKTKTNLNLV